MANIEFLDSTADPRLNRHGAFDNNNNWIVRGPLFEFDFRETGFRLKFDTGNLGADSSDEDRNWQSLGVAASLKEIPVQEGVLDN